MNQVHKETVNQVENALPNRQGLDVEIFGMEGVPQDILEQHRTRIIQNFYQAQENRRLATGNPLPGQSLNSARRKIHHETAEELLRRLAEWRAHKKAGTLPPTADSTANQYVCFHPLSFLSSPSPRPNAQTTDFSPLSFRLMLCRNAMLLLAAMTLIS